VTRRSVGVLVGGWLAVVFGAVWFALGPAEGSLVVGTALASVGLVVGGTELALGAAGRRRVRALAPTRPGWRFVPAATTRTEISAMRAVGKRVVVGSTVTLGWGPDGVGLWTSRRLRPVAVLGCCWAQVADVTQTDTLVGSRGYPASGVRITLCDGTVHELRTAGDRGLRAAHPGTTPAGAVAADLLDVRARS
jgi:hypothetical protein